MPNTGLRHISLKTRDLKKTEKKLKENRVEIEGRRGRNAIYFSDPNGYCVEFYCD
ncbi:MAG: VOC family protein [Deltaproteobacteria bacterium]|nr:VOC family protein [Deltaproteobacteria bacterium]